MNSLVNDINQLFQYAVKLTGSKQDGEDLIQDLAEVVFKIPEYYAGKTETERKMIFCRILKNIFINRAVFYAKQSKGFSKYNPKHVENDVWGKLQKLELQKALKDYECGRYHDKKRTLPFRLRLEGYNVNEISEITNIPLKKAYTSISNTTRFLKKKFAA